MLNKYFGSMFTLEELWYIPEATTHFWQCHEGTVTDIVYCLRKNMVEQLEG